MNIGKLIPKQDGPIPFIYRLHKVDLKAHLNPTVLIRQINLKTICINKWKIFLLRNS